MQETRTNLRRRGDGERQGGDGGPGEAERESAIQPERHAAPEHWPRSHCQDLAALALALAVGGLSHDELWEELVHNLGFEAHRLSGPAAASAVYAAARAGRCPAVLFEGLARRIGERSWELSALDCARAAGGFLRGPTGLAEGVVFKGPICDRALELGFGSFNAEAITLFLDALSRTPPGMWGVEVMAGALLEELHPRLGELSGRQAASVARSLGHLRPQAPGVLSSVFNYAQAVVATDYGCAIHAVEK